MPGIQSLECYLRITSWILSRENRFSFQTLSFEKHLKFNMHRTFKCFWRRLSAEKLKIELFSFRLQVRPPVVGEPVWREHPETPQAFPPWAPWGPGRVTEVIVFGVAQSTLKGFLCGSAGKESACNAGNLGSIPGLGRSPGEGKGYPLQYSGLENSVDCIVHEIAKSRTRLSNLQFSSVQSTLKG